MKYWLFSVLLLFFLPVFAGEDKCLTPSHIGQKTLCTYVAERPIVMDVWFPTKKGNPHQQEGVFLLPPIAYDAPVPKQGKLPLIVMSHGYGGERKEQLWLAEKLALAGYIVASIDHYGNTWKDPTPEGMVKVWNRPQDISYAIDYLTETSPFASVIDKDHIGFVGFSVGGMTGLWLAGAKVKSEEAMHHFASESYPEVNYQEALQSYKDDRIKQFVLLAPRATEFTKESLESIQEPLLIIYGEKDTVLPPEEHALGIQAPYQQILRLPEANHFVFLNEVSKQGKDVLSSDLWEDQSNQANDHVTVCKHVTTFLKSPLN